MEDWAFFDIMREIVFWSSPVIFLLGIILLINNNFQNVESLAAKEFGLRKRIFPALEHNVYVFHNWCLKRRVWIGLACIMYALVVFFVLRKFSSLGEVIGEV